MANENILLRPIEPEDLETLYRWENNPALWVASDTHTPYSRYAIKQYIANSKQDIYEDRQLRLIIESKSTGKSVGTVDLFDFDLHNSRVSLGLFVDSAFQGKGYAKQALHLIETYVFDFLKINQLYIHIACTNTVTLHLFEQDGYEKNGILKQWIRLFDNFVDVVVFQQFRENYLTKTEVENNTSER